MRLQARFPMKTVNAEVVSLLEYRMNAIAIGHLALRHSARWDQIPSIDIFFDGNQIIEGKATAFTNGAIEAAIIHSRALLEFLGLKCKSKSKLKELIDRKQGDDIGIEQYEGLTRVSIQSVAISYAGEAAEVEAAFAYVIYLANKGLAHTTSSFTRNDDGAKLLEVAFREVPSLIIKCFHEPLRVDLPKYKLQWRSRYDLSTDTMDRSK